jgi:hypothetical protein
LRPLQAQKKLNVTDRNRQQAGSLYVKPLEKRAARQKETPTIIYKPLKTQSS